VMTGATGPSGSLDCCISLCGCSNSHQQQVTVCHDTQDPSPILLTGQYGCLHSRKAGSAIRSPVPSPHQEPGTGARSCPRGPGFLVARAIELAQAYVLDAGRPNASRTHSANRSASTSATIRVAYRRPFVAAMA
jgi:hypothetical protein